MLNARQYDFEYVNPLKRILTGLSILLLAVVTLTGTAAWAQDAANSTDGSDNSAVITFEAIGAEFEFYRAADFIFAEDGTFSFAVTNDFAASQVELEELTEDKWQSAAETLEAYALTHGLSPLKSAVIGESGEAVLSDLPNGLYLIRSAAAEYGGYTYSATCTLVTLPTTTDKPATNMSSWSNGLTVMPKVTKTENQKEGKNYKIVKQWSGDSKDSRPEKITVTITCVDGNGVKTDQSVELNAENDWSYSWKSEDTAAEYYVDETPVPADYTRTLKRTEDEEQNLVIFTLTNKGTKKETETEPHTNPPGKNVKTGDGSRILLMLLLFACSGCILLLSLRRSLKSR